MRFYLAATVLIMNCLFAIGSKAACSFDFTASKTIICENEIVTFKVVGLKGTVKKIVWDLGVKTVSNDSVVSALYPKKSKYKISLTITFNDNTSCTVTKNDLIEVLTKPDIGSISVSTKLICGLNQSVTIKNTATGAVKWDWIIEGKTHSTTTNSVTHNFTTSGKPSVQLTVSNIAGCSVSKYYESGIEVYQEPTVNATTYDVTLCKLPDTAGIRPRYEFYNNKITQFDWTFKGATIEADNQQFPKTKTYTTDGYFPINLKLTSDKGCEYNYNFKGYIKAEKRPNAFIKAVPNGAAGCNISSYTFIAENFGDANHLSWKFGSMDSVKYNTAFSPDSIYTGFVYQASYRIKLSMMTGQCVHNFYRKIIIDREPFKLTVDAPNCVCDFPKNLTLTPTSNQTDIKLKWELFRPGKRLPDVFSNKSLQLNVIHKGHYRIMLTGTDGNGCQVKWGGGILANNLKIDTGFLDKNYCLQTKIPIHADSLCFPTTPVVNISIFDSLNKEVIRNIGYDESFVFPKVGTYSIGMSLRSGTCVDTNYWENRLFARRCNYRIYPRIGFDGYIGCFRKSGYGIGVDNYSKKVIKNVIAYNLTTPFDTAENSFNDKQILVKTKHGGIYSLKVTLTDANNVDTVLVVDSILKISKIAVEGKMAVNGCYPNQKGFLRVKKVQNFVFKLTDTSALDTAITYHWGTNPIRKWDILDTTARNTAFGIIENEQVDVVLKATNSMGCTSIWKEYNAMKNTLFADFFTKGEYCLEDQVPLVNNSTGPIDIYAWSSSENSDVFIGGNSIHQPFLRATKPGNREITLVVYAKDGCNSTVKKSINFLDIKLDFSVNDTSSRCTPALYVFDVTKSKSITSCTWIFGDGDTLITNENQVSKVYDLSVVKPYRNVFDVTLIGSNKKECDLKVFKPGLIKLRGPVPNISVENNIGCSPLEVKFKDESINAFKIYIDYGDATSVDSTIQPKYTYYSDGSKEWEEYRPFIVAHDNTGCSVSQYIKDTIKSYSYPIASFNTSVRSGCEDLTVDLISNSKYAYQHKWQVSGVKVNDPDNAVARVSLPNGLYDVILEVKNKLGCIDTAFKPSYLQSFRNPVAKMSFTDTVTCIGRPFSFTSESTADVKISKTYWSLSLKGILSEYFEKTMQTSFKEPGKLDVTLIVEDLRGCKDTLQKHKLVHIYEKMPVVVPQIYLASVEQPGQIELQFAATPKAYYYSYQIQNQGSTIRDVFNWDDTNYVYNDTSTVKTFQCFKVNLIDKCQEHHLSTEHCNVKLDIDHDRREEIYLSWNHYVGWPLVAKYIVQRRNEKSNYYLIGEVEGDINAFTDSFFCDSIYEYRVIAVHRDGELQSKSTIDTIAPYYRQQDSPLSLNLATVIDNKNVMITWQKTILRNKPLYLIDREEKLEGRITNWKSAVDTFYIDSSAEINRYFYSYQVRVIDHCKNTNKWSNEANSILLSVNQQNRDVVLSWNPYQKWVDGVKEYLIEVRKPSDSVFVPLTSTKETFWSDTAAFLLYEKAYAYRVKAVENGPNPDTSYSNIRQLVPLAAIYAPNAFTPNGDGINDQFVIKGSALAEDLFSNDGFNLLIYNRWGEKVFESNDIAKGWDGSFQGKIAGADVYYFVFNVRALDGTRYYLSGNITLIR